MRLLSYGCDKTGFDKTGVTLRETEQSGIWHKTEAPGTILNDDTESFPDFIHRTYAQKSNSAGKNHVEQGIFMQVRTVKHPVQRAETSPKQEQDNGSCDGYKSSCYENR